MIALDDKSGSILGDLLAQVVNETADLEAMENFKAYCSDRSKRDVTRVLGRRKL